MPEHYFPDDAKWIQEQLTKLSPSMRQKALVKYSEVYQTEWEREQVPYRKDNKARHEANVRLREFIKRYQRAMQG
ncbi:hypothetical protein E4V27_18860, partial [Proteus mirabilis]